MAWPNAVVALHGAQMMLFSKLQRRPYYVQATVQCTACYRDATCFFAANHVRHGAMTCPCAPGRCCRCWAAQAPAAAHPHPLQGHHAFVLAVSCSICATDQRTVRPASHVKCLRALQHSPAALLGSAVVGVAQTAPTAGHHEELVVRVISVQHRCQALERTVRWLKAAVSCVGSSHIVLRRTGVV
jgi:hypothetical protein